MRKAIKRGSRRTSRVKKACAAWMRRRKARDARWRAEDANLTELREYYAVN